MVSTKTKAMEMRSYPAGGSSGAVRLKTSGGKTSTESVTVAESAPASTGEGASSTVVELEQELRYTRENLQTTIEELETSNEELKSSNEELQSTNEELQSTNEELETSKEELQSLNEESTTVNTELQSRIEELSKANDDMKNLLDSTQIATTFLDIDLCAYRFTPTMTEIVPLAATDIGPFHILLPIWSTWI